MIGDNEPACSNWSMKVLWLQCGRSDSVIMLICSPNNGHPTGSQDALTIEIGKSPGR